ncbi:MAG: HypC/HybG/HupF family hydrogenase formation chaperone [Clostridiales Family XIII bacterium]|jgi:hydrogenase expression/formation protein HypC|nr:HypC/HybG/HupF family hydrogenase formation chaperone [Clostridiales Family XIII bacterium]
MCIAAPMTIETVHQEENTAVAVLNGNRLTVDISLIPVKVGDSVLVHAGCVLQILSMDEAEEMVALFEELERLSGI